MFHSITCTTCKWNCGYSWVHSSLDHQSPSEAAAICPWPLPDSDWDGEKHNSWFLCETENNILKPIGYKDSWRNACQKSLSWILKEISFGYFLENKTKPFYPDIISSQNFLQTNLQINLSNKIIPSAWTSILHTSINRKIISLSKCFSCLCNWQVTSAKQQLNLAKHKWELITAYQEGRTQSAHQTGNPSEWMLLLY